ncbi:MAG TPA: YidC/Oxa1 family membrane protein insertase [Firmicutes bacterium]|uniref:Membrane protein insertase YidC n=2 Tax=Capillibacterium thermochitinicola TaxID=2699427 RepID=A0A8J6LIN0_9FIRM|nr:membrane protein insertase YidC [Capillibacterium thermochitinicola]HHW12204.1 YidC/Oxa1 family membrane protein insertase [Bacillota bacterium]
MISTIMANILTFFHDTLGVGWGMAIILLTLLVKVVLFPFTLSQIRSMEGLKKIQPEMKKIQEKYKHNPEEQQRKVMELYQKHKVNPFGGCLPLLLQLPILFALFNVLRVPENYNLDFTNAYFLTMDLTKSHSYWLLAAISGLTSYLQQKMTTVSTTDPSQSTLMYVMPVFMGYVTYTLKAGIGVYWVASTVIGIVQQWIITKFFIHEEQPEIK